MAPMSLYGVAIAWTTFRAYVGIGLSLPVPNSEIPVCMTKLLP